MRRREASAWRGGALALVVVAFLAPPAAAGLAVPETIRVARLALSADEHLLSMERLEIAWRPGQPIALSVDRIEGPLGTLPLWASARLRPDAAGWRLTGVVASGPGDVVLRLDGSGLGGAAGRLAIDAEPIRFAPGSLQPRDLWPGLGGYARAVTGTIDLAAVWQPGGAGEESLTLAIDDLRFATDYGPVGPVVGTLSLDRIWPPRTAEPQQLTIQSIRLENLVESFAIEALGAEGTVDADLRFSLTEEGRVFIDEGLLEARSAGVLRYRPDRPPAALAGQGQGVELLLTALSDFRYDAMRAMVRGYLDDQLTVELALSGANPELYEGHPIELNVNLEAPVLPLVAAGRDAWQLPEAIRRAIERRHGGAPEGGN